MTHELKRVVSREDWAVVHAIRKAVLFAPGRHPGAVYNDAHPADAAANRVPFLLLYEGEPIGVVRLDLDAGMGTVRLVAVVADRQGQGHGAVMEQLVANHALRLGITTLRVNSAPDAVGFYEKRGWQREIWDAAEMTGIASKCVQMVKHL